MNDHQGKKPPNKNYRNPPEAYRFKKGQSGNPSGRPKRDKKPVDIGELIQEVLTGPVCVINKGKRTYIPAVKALARKYCASGLQGDHRAAETLLKYAKEYRPARPEPAFDPVDHGAEVRRKLAEMVRNKAEWARLQEEDRLRSEGRSSAAPNSNGDDDESST